MMLAENRQPQLSGNRNLVFGSFQFFIKPSYINKLTGFLLKIMVYFKISTIII